MRHPTRTAAILTTAVLLLFGGATTAGASSTTSRPDATHQHCATSDGVSQTCYTSAVAADTARAAQSVLAEVLFWKSGGGTFRVWARDQCGPVNLAVWDNRTAAAGEMTWADECGVWHGYDAANCWGNWLGSGTIGQYVTLNRPNALMCVEFN